jgi:phosphoenolpyruvate synthase/pyruvate phosphate dikinase
MTNTSIQRVRSLADLAGEDIALVGNKAATLATLKRARFPVLEGVVLTTEARADAPAAGGLDDGARQADIEAISPPTDLPDALAARRASIVEVLRNEHTRG